ncbi:hypothetical protein F5Y09DRAFT_304618 [Xylaria sp. FL1042]|nr:hypothetical protein F5Y09DRAFT_304618 [Xylaria sp. FL1042]
MHIIVLNVLIPQCLETTVALLCGGRSLWKHTLIPPARNKSETAAIPKQPYSSLSYTERRLIPSLLEKTRENKGRKATNKGDSLISFPMDLWNTVLAKLTKPRYMIESSWGSQWWHVLESQTSASRESPVTVALVAQILFGSHEYKLELGGKDSEALTIIASKIPTSMDRHSQAFRFGYERIAFAWIYYSKSLSFPCFLSFYMFSWGKRLTLNYHRV